MLNIAFMLAEKQSDDTSDFVKRDIQGKKDRKEFPNMVCAPYLNIDKEGRISGKSFTAEKMMMLLKLERSLKRVEIDPIEGPLWKQLGEEIIRDRLSLGKAQERAHQLNLTGTYSNKPIVKSTIKLTFNNPFLYGMMRTNTGIDPGEHEPLFTKAEFDLINAILSNTKKSKFKVKLENKYNGICFCGECGRAWSTEPPKRYGKRYLRCAKSRKDYKCTQPYLEVSEFERQIEEELKKLQLSTRLIQWIIKQLEKGNEFELERNDVLRKSLQHKLNLLTQEFDMYSKKWKSLDNINGELVSNSEYIVEKKKYKEAKEALEEELNRISQQRENWIEEIDEFFTFSQNLYHTFHNKGDNIQEKRRLLCLIASNITITDKKVRINYNNKYVILKRIADLKIEEISSFEQLNLYNDSEIRVKSSILSELRRAVDNVRTAILNLDYSISIPDLEAI